MIVFTLGIMNPKDPTMKEAVNTLDWYGLPQNGKPAPQDLWPWVNIVRGRFLGSEAVPDSKTATKTLRFADAPELAIPAQFDGTQPDKDKLQHVEAEEKFVVSVAARTKDESLSANTHYFNGAFTSGTVSYRCDARKKPADQTDDTKVEIHTNAAATDHWYRPTMPTEADVNVIPNNLARNDPFVTWVPQK